MINSRRALEISELSAKCTLLLSKSVINFKVYDFLYSDFKTTSKIFQTSLRNRLSMHHNLGIPHS
jgi:hypothetical protein